MRRRLSAGIVNVHYSLALCTRTSFLGRREYVGFVLSSTSRKNRAETEIDAFHIKTIIFGGDSCI
jgi:hypothetical protein